MAHHRVGVVVVAGGSGTRLGAEVPKALVPLLDHPLLAHTLSSITRAAVALIDSTVERAIVVAPRRHLDEIEAVVTSTAESVSANHWLRNPDVIVGGRERQDSVRAGIEVATDVDTLVIHDAARPFVTARAFADVVEAAAKLGAAITALPAVDTVKLVDASGRIRATPPRNEVRLAQTPQAFRRDVLLAAHAAAEENSATDDAALVEACGHPVHVVAGDAAMRKITTMDDLRWAEWMLRSGQWPR